MSAVWSNIVFNEYMRLILGPTAHAQLELGPFEGEYDPNLNPDLDTEFSTAAFRYGHTLLPDEIVYTTQTFNPFERILMRDVS